MAIDFFDYDGVFFLPVKTSQKGYAVSRGWSVQAGVYVVAPVFRLFPKLLEGKISSLPSYFVFDSRRASAAISDTSPGWA